MTLYDSMVHYNPDPRDAAHAPPPVCPKCGSHRTEIVGTSAGGILTVRCNSCGERSTINMESKATVASGDGVTAEFGVMQTLGQELERLPDSESRTRVL